MATFSKRKGKWCVQIRRSFHKPINKTFVSKSDADRFARETERLIEQGQFVDTTEANKTTLRTLLERYGREVSPLKKSRVDKYYIRNICKHNFVDKMLSHVSSSDIAEFRDARLATTSTRGHSKVSGSSVNRELSLISDCINKAITEWKCFIRENPVKKGIRCKENSRRIRRLRGNEYDLLMGSCKSNRAFWCPIIDFAIHSGMRRGELLAIRWDWVDFDRKYVTLPPQVTKTERARNVPLQPHAISILKNMSRSISGRIFPIGIKNFERSWRAICARAGVEGLRFHDLKREAVSRLFEKGLSVTEVQLFVGNSLNTLGVYTEHDSTTLAEKLAK